MGFLNGHSVGDRSWQNENKNKETKKAHISENIRPHLTLLQLTLLANASDSLQTLGKKKETTEIIQALRMAEQSFDGEKDENYKSVFLWKMKCNIDSRQTPISGKLGRHYQLTTAKQV